MVDDESVSPIVESAGEDEFATNLEHDDECDIKLVENNCFIISSELPKKVNIYLDQEHSEGAAVFKKRVAKSKTIGQKTENDLKKIQEYGV